MDKSAALGPMIAKWGPKVIKKGKNAKDWFFKGVKTTKDGKKVSP